MILPSLITNLVMTYYVWVNQVLRWRIVVALLLVWCTTASQRFICQADCIGLRETLSSFKCCSMKLVPSVPDWNSFSIRTFIIVMTHPTWRRKTLDSGQLSSEHSPNWSACRSCASISLSVMTGHCSNSQTMQPILCRCTSSFLISNMYFWILIHYDNF